MGNLMTSLLERPRRPCPLAGQGIRVTVATAIWTGMAQKERMRLIVDGSCFRPARGCLSQLAFRASPPTSTIQVQFHQPPSSHPSTPIQPSPTETNIQTSKRPDCMPLTVMDELDKCCVWFVRHSFPLFASVQGLRIVRLPIDTRKKEARIDLLALPCRAQQGARLPQPLLSTVQNKARTAQGPPLPRKSAAFGSGQTMVTKPGPVRLECLRSGAQRPTSQPM